jgi:hypothetical protein
MSPSFYPPAVWSATIAHRRLTMRVPVSPVFACSIALAMTIAPTLGATQSISDEGLTGRNKAVVNNYLDEIAQRGNIIAREL